MFFRRSAVELLSAMPSRFSGAETLAANSISSDDLHAVAETSRSEGAGATSACQRLGTKQRSSTDRYSRCVPKKEPPPNRRAFGLTAEGAKVRAKDAKNPGARRKPPQWNNRNCSRAGMIPLDLRRAGGPPPAAAPLAGRRRVQQGHPLRAEPLRPGTGRAPL